MTDVQFQISAEADTISSTARFQFVLHNSAKVGENTYPAATALLPNELEETLSNCSVLSVRSTECPLTSFLSILTAILVPSME